LIAFFSDSKAVTIHINNLGEQYFDLIALFIIWFILLFGFVILYRVLKEQKTSKDFNYELNKVRILDKDDKAFDSNSRMNVNYNKRNITGIFVESDKKSNKKLNLED
jgi:hypothetical protein